MSDITVIRHTFTDKYTMGDLFYNGVKICDTCEDTYRDLSKEKKVWGETAIPYGIYGARVENHTKFGTIVRLFDVPFFDGILIHAGNTAVDSKGCILVGKEGAIKGFVAESRPTLKNLTSTLGTGWKGFVHVKKADASTDPM